MKQRKLGQSGIELSPVGLGANYVGGHNLYANVDEDEGVRLVQRAVDLGMTHIDTADGYGRGRSEELIGKALSGRRDQVILATKGGVLFGEHGQGVSNDPAYLRGALERSLQRLQTDYIDLYYIHKPDGKTPMADAIGALMDFKREGLIRAIGVSNFTLSALQAGASAGQIDALQARYNLLQREAEGDVLPWCVANGTSFIPWGGLAYGLLGGCYNRDFTLDANDWRHRTGLFSDGEFARNLDVVDTLKSIAAGSGTSTVQLAVQWLLNKPGVDSVIAGAKTVEQVNMNLVAGEVVVDAAQLAAVDALTV